MEKELELIGEINGKPIRVYLLGHQMNIVVDDVCEALDLSLVEAVYDLKKDDFLATQFALLESESKYFALMPISYSLGWVFNLKSNSTDFDKQKLAVYEIIYNHVASI
jgi:hypothetical protein